MFLSFENNSNMQLLVSISCLAKKSAPRYVNAMRPGSKTQWKKASNALESILNMLATESCLILLVAPSDVAFVDCIRLISEK